MAKVSCEVYGCTYNCDGGCRLESIRIEGARAEKACDTVCESYTDRTEKGYVNCTPADCACGACSIEGDAQDCKHNTSNHCTAPNITVSGSASKGQSGTECETFTKG